MLEKAIRYADTHYPEGRPMEGTYTRLMADHLLSEGVIVPPCKVGDTVYYLNTRPHIGLFRDKVYEAVVSRIVVNWLGVSIVIRIKTDEGVCEVPSIYDFGKIVFTSR